MHTEWVFNNLEAMLLPTRGHEICTYYCRGTTLTFVAADQKHFN